MSAQAQHAASAQERPGRLGVGIVGAGKVGAVLGAALRAAGHSIVGVSAASDQSQERAELLLPGVPILSVEDVVERCELVLLAVPDDVLPELVAGLASLGRWHAGQLVVHTSGRYGVGVLAPIRSVGAIPLALHPVMTFTGLSVDVARLQDATFGVTADAAFLPIAQALAVEVGAEPVVVAEADRSLYHAALAQGANHAATLIAQSLQVLSDIGVPDAARVLRPLVHATVDNALALGEDALTGPVARADVETVRAHIHALAEGAPDVLASYRAMAAATAGRALARGVITAQQWQALALVLADGETNEDQDRE